MYPEWKSHDKEVRAHGAKKFVEKISRDLSDDIQYSIENSTIYHLSNLAEWEPQSSMKIFLTKYSTSTALDALRSQLGQDERICALNFASYKNPGGKFLAGSKAQEEALCATSILYPVLESFQDTYYQINKGALNRGLYFNKAIYSHDITFVDYERQKSFQADVITCAAPNNSVGLKYQSFTAQDNHDALKKRIQFVYNIAASESVDTLVLGAWGCGVFKQDPTEVASLMMQLALKKPPVKNLVFAIPASMYDSRNYNAFREQIMKWAPDSIVIS